MKVILSTPRAKSPPASPVNLAQRVDSLSDYLECGGVATSLFPNDEDDTLDDERRPERALGRVAVLLLIILAVLFIVFVVWLCAFTRAIIR